MILGLQVPGYENGNFVGPTILRDVTSNMECYKVLLFVLLFLFAFSELMDLDNYDSQWKKS